MKTILLLTFTAILATCGSSQATSGTRQFPARDTNAVVLQDSVPPYMTNEVSFGIGAAYSPEKDMFNVPDDIAAGTNVAISLSYMRNLNEQFAIGVNMYGYFKTIDNASITTSASSQTVQFSFSTLNIGAVGRYIFSRERVQPYGFVLLAYSSGLLTNPDLGNLHLSGVSGGGGLGANIMLGSNWALSLEGLASFGTAKWEQAPFSNSTGDAYNPSMLMGMVKVSYLWI